MHLVVVCIQALMFRTALSMGCVDEEGKPVDWVVMYKLPKMDSS